MKIVSEVNFYDFEAWSGGRDTMNDLLCNLDHCELDALEEKILDVIDPEREGITDTQLNDFLWFEADTIAQLLGYDDWESWLKSCDDEEDEDDEEDDEEDED